MHNNYFLVHPRLPRYVPKTKINSVSSRSCQGVIHFCFIRARRRYQACRSNEHRHRIEGCLPERRRWQQAERRRRRRGGERAIPQSAHRCCWGTFYYLSSAVCRCQQFKARLDNLPRARERTRETGRGRGRQLKEVTKAPSVGIEGRQFRDN